MAKDIDPRLTTVSNYLKLDSAKFIIPEYQREYTWDVANCDKLWADIEDFMGNDSKDPYFFGTIIVSCSNEDTELNIIDGQQRTTTFTLLLKALLTKTNEKILSMVDDADSDDLKKKLRDRRKELMSILYDIDEDDVADKPNDEKDAAIYHGFTKIVNKSNQEMYKNDLVSILKAPTYAAAETAVVKFPYKRQDNRYTNFFRNFKHFYTKEKLDDAAFLNKFIKTLLTECQIIEIKSWKVEQAIVMFNSLNSDGVPLTDSDIIYSKMFANAKNEEDKQALGEKWRYLVALTTSLKEQKIVSLTGLLNQKMYLYRTLNGDTINESGGIDITTPGLRRYYIDLNQDLVKRPVAFCDELIKLAEIWNIVKDSAIMKVLARFNDNSKIFLASYFHRFDNYFTKKDDCHFEISDENKAKLLQNVQEIAEPMLKLFAILSLVDAEYSSANFKTFLFKEERHLANEEFSNDDLKHDFYKHITSTWKRDDIEDAISSYEHNDLVFLHEYIFAKDTGAELCFEKEVDIEHIMPQSGVNKSTIRRDAGIADNETFDTYINKIGNKILLEYDINRSIGNAWFRTKVEKRIDDKEGYVGSKYPLANFLVEQYKSADHPYWTKGDIDNATEAASTRIADFIFSE